jgi:multicomponent K+:H+ antiporter subunit G
MSVQGIVDALVAALLVGGAGFALVGSIGLLRFGDFYRRLHGPTKATTLGVGAVLLASSLFFSFASGTPSLREILVLVFLFVTAPVGAQALVKSALAEDAAAPAPPDTVSGATAAADGPGAPSKAPEGP